MYDEDEKAKMAANYHDCRNKELQILSELENCEFENDELLKLLVHVQQERARLARMLQID